MAIMIIINNTSDEWGFNFKMLLVFATKFNYLYFAMSYVTTLHAVCTCKLTPNSNLQLNTNNC